MKTLSRRCLGTKNIPQSISDEIVLRLEKLEDLEGLAGYGSSTGRVQIITCTAAFLRLSQLVELIRERIPGWPSYTREALNSIANHSDSNLEGFQSGTSR
jgi:hypothetical protein